MARRNPPTVFPRAQSRSLLDGRVLTCAEDDGTPRWRPGERLEALFEARADIHPGHPAVDIGPETLSYGGTDARANQLARYLTRLGVRPGDRVALLPGTPLEGYLGMLAALKAGAAFVPLDAAFPADRLAWIVTDAGASVVLSSSELASQTAPLTEFAKVIHTDAAAAEIAAESEERPLERGGAADSLCYVIYTSGSTGRPKGVAVSHSSICNFVTVAATTYGIQPSDRVYQGMTIAFDFSAEEIWVPWMSGASLVPKPDRTVLLGADLHDFLSERGVTALACVPTLLATLPEDLPGLRFLLVSGEACPPDLAARWHRPGRRFLNVYGPTEATVTCTWAVVDPDRPVTIGVPLPTYAAVILDPSADRALEPGELGEITVAGIGLADGYVNRPEETGRVFIRDFLRLPANPSGRLYRTGDLGRITPDGELEHLGRIDTQVKVRGYRVELTEIESVLLAEPGVAQAVVDACQREPGRVELAAYYSRRPAAPPLDSDAVFERLRARLPSYMVPDYLEELAAVPLLPSGKADRKSLPAPRGPRRLAASGAYAAPATDTERTLARVLTGVLGVDRLSADSHFFDELGANSLLMAQFNAALRACDGLPAVSMRDVYAHPSVRRLAAWVDRPESARAGTGGARLAGVSAEATAMPPTRGTPRIALCGLLQVSLFLGYVCGGAVGIDDAGTWILEGRGALETSARLVAMGAAGLLAMGLFPIAAKWALAGRRAPERIRVWSLAYVRFWLVKTLVTANPLARLSVGTPLAGLYLRALGARVGKGVLIFTTHLPACPDLLTIGDGAIIRKDALLPGYHAQDGVIETGPVSLGADVFVGEASVLGIHTAMGDGAQLGHTSSLQPGQRVPAGERWHGSPARPAGAGEDYRTVPPARCGQSRRALFGAARLLFELTVFGTLEVSVPIVLLARPSPVAHLLGVSAYSWMFYRDALMIATAVVIGLALAGLPLVVAVARLSGKALRPGRVYPLYGWRYALLRVVNQLTNIKFFPMLFGDSSAIPHYLRALGWRLAPVIQTGSNFGTEVRHEMPGLASLGTGTMVSDGLVMLSAEYSPTSFRVAPARVGRHNYLGNNVIYPPGGKTGDNCLLATKVMIPVTGPVREGVGLLGSPAFEIPRSVARDQLITQASEADRARLLAAKNRHNAVTVVLFLLTRWVYVLGVALIALLPTDGWGIGEFAATLALVAAEIVFTATFQIAAEWASLGFRRLRPQSVSMYTREFWRHERYWKLAGDRVLTMFNGTPAKPLMWRLLGVRVGCRVFDDGCHITERTLVTIGAGCTLNTGSHLQSHTLEDGAFKSGHIVIRAGCVIGPGAWVSYGVVMGDGSALAADSFLMKGEQVPPGRTWRGNPAAEVDTAAGGEDGLGEPAVAAELSPR